MLLDCFRIFEDLKDFHLESKPQITLPFGVPNSFKSYVEMKDIGNLDGCDTPAGGILAKPHALSYYDDMKESFERRNDKTVFLHLNTPLKFVAHVTGI